MRTLFEKLPIKGWRLLAFLLMLFSVLLSFNEYEVVKEISFFGKSFGTEKDVASIAPGFISTLFSCALFAVFMLRRAFNMSDTNKADYLILVVDILFVSSFMTTLVEGKEIPLLGVSPQAFLIGAFLFSLLGLRSLSGWALIIVLLFSMGTISRVNSCMGVWGAFYVLCGFLSLSIQIVKLKYCLIGVSLNLLKDDFRGVIDRGSEDIKVAKDAAINVVNSTKESAQNIVSITGM
jgi:hypothetical protein